MIPAGAVTAWIADHPWPTREQVEQDLLLSRAICAIADDPYLSRELVFRGGTALHKLHLAKPLRYSEVLDYVRTSATGIKELTAALTGLGESLGFTVRTRVSEHPRVLWRALAQTGVPLRIKIKVNTHERSPSLPHVLLPYAVRSPWWTAEAEIRTFQAPELVATKIRALYQRSKGRDLFDLWLALDQLELDPAAIVAAYRPAGMTMARAIANLDAKTRDRSFRADLGPLVAVIPEGFDVDDAAHRINTDLLSHLDGLTEGP